MKIELSPDLRSYLEEVHTRVQKYGLSGVPEHEATAHLVGMFISDAAEGGMRAFMLGPTSEHAVATVAALRRIGGEEAAGLVQKAWRTLPPEIAARPLSERAAYARALGPEVMGAWDRQQQLLEHALANIDIFLWGYMTAARALFEPPQESGA